MTSSHPERRKYPRRNIFLPTMCWQLESGKPIDPGFQIDSKDLSENGIAFLSSVIYSIGTLLRCEMYLPGRKNPVLSQIKIVSVESLIEKGRYQIGATFADISLEDRNFIAQCLDRMNLYTLLEKATRLNASDLHLTVGHPPILRLQGQIQPMEMPPIEEGQIKAMIYPLLNEFQIDFFEKNKELDFAFSPNIGSRFRVNLHQQRGFMEVAMRSIPVGSRALESLGLPLAPIQKLCQEKGGLILIIGKTGSGKTTTMTAMMDYINRHFERVIISIEDPIEYIHKGNKCVIKQRELGSDTQSYAGALRHALRQDPDIIVVGELLESDSISAAIRAAETGHLVITTLHGPDIVQGLGRMVNFFPPEHAASIYQQLSSCLIGVIFQVLVPDKKGNLVLVTELLLNNPAIRNTIREGHLSQIRSYIQTGSSLGMYTLESELKKLYDKGIIELKTMQDYLKEG